MNMTKELSESLLAACKAAGIVEPKYIAQDEDGTVYHYQSQPSRNGYQYMWGNHQGIATPLNHPPYAEDWQDSLMEWVDHVADTSKMIDEAIKMAYQKHLEKGDGFRWSRLDCYRAAWQDALAWKAMAEEGGASE